MAAKGAKEFNEFSFSMSSMSALIKQRRYFFFFSLRNGNQMVLEEEMCGSVTSDACVYSRKV